MWVFVRMMCNIRMCGRVHKTNMWKGGGREKRIEGRSGRSFLIWFCQGQLSPAMRLYSHPVISPKKQSNFIVQFRIRAQHHIQILAVPAHNCTRCAKPRKAPCKTMFLLLFDFCFRCFCSAFFVARVLTPQSVWQNRKCG